MPLPLSGSASVDGAMAFPSMDFGTQGGGGGDPFGPPLGPPPPPNALPPGNIDVKRVGIPREIWTLIPTWTITTYWIWPPPTSVPPPRPCHRTSLALTRPSPVPPHRRPWRPPQAQQAVPTNRRAQRRPSGDPTTKKLSKTVRKRGSTLKKSGSNNSLSSLDGAVARLDVSTETGSVGSLDSPVGAGAASSAKKTVKDKKPGAGRSPRTSPSGLCRRTTCECGVGWVGLG